MSSFLKIASLSAALFSPETKEKERLEILSAYFKPSFHKELKLHKEEEAHIKFKDNPYDARGFITVSPPKGHCFIVQRHEDIADDYICKPKTLSFKLSDLDYGGKITWKVSTGEGDFGTVISWQTPYRLGQYVTIDTLRKNRDNHLTIITKCEAFTEPFRSVKLTTMRGKEWVFRFPKVDTLLPQPEEGPNLYYSKGRTGAGVSRDPLAKKEKKEQQGPEDPAEEYLTADGEKADEASFTNIFRKMKKTKIYYWNLSERKTYHMSADHFVASGSPKGGPGLCRYRFVGAPHDKKNGLIECLFTKEHDAILAPITCAQHLENPGGM